MKVCSRIDDDGGDDGWAGYKPRSLSLSSGFTLFFFHFIKIPEQFFRTIM